MDRQYIQDNQIIERYLQNKLSEEETAAFEEYYLSDAITLEELELAEGMQRGAQELKRSGYLRSSWLRSVFLSPQYAAAASVLALVSMLSLGVVYQRGISTDTTLVNTRVVPIFATRGPTINVLASAAANEQLVLLVDPGDLGYDSYRATVSRETDQGTRQIWQMAELAPGYQEMLALGLPGELLRPGDYHVNLEGRADDGYDYLTRIRFEVVDQR